MQQDLSANQNKLWNVRYDVMLEMLFPGKIKQVNFKWPLGGYKLVYYHIARLVLNE